MASEHFECDCVPNLGPPHCHGCSEACGEAVPWPERMCKAAGRVLAGKERNSD